MPSKWHFGREMVLDTTAWPQFPDQAQPHYLADLRLKWWYIVYPLSVTLRIAQH